MTSSMILAALQPCAVVALLGLVLLEREQPTQSIAPDELGTNLALGAIMLVSDAIVLTAAAILFTALQPHVLLVDPLPFAVQLTVALIAGDFISYWHHRLLHSVPVLWASHVVHHQSRSIDLSTGLRNHPAVTITSAACWSPLLVLGISPMAMGLAVAIIGAWVILLHRKGNRSPSRSETPFGLVLNQPSHHRMHHRADRDCNYGLLLSLWDRLFGTFQPEHDSSARYGVPGRCPVGSLDELLWAEWRRIVGRPSSGPERTALDPAKGIVFYLGAVLASAMVPLFLARVE